jgi:hypothetical protein
MASPKSHNKLVQFLSRKGKQKTGPVLIPHTGLTVQNQPANLEWATCHFRGVPASNWTLIAGFDRKSKTVRFFKDSKKYPGFRLLIGKAALGAGWKVPKTSINVPSSAIVMTPTDKSKDKTRRIVHPKTVEMGNGTATISEEEKKRRVDAALKRAKIVRRVIERKLDITEETIKI